MAYKDKLEAIKHVNEFNKQNYDRVTVLVPKGDKDKLKSHAQQMGESVNSFVQRAIKTQMQIDTESKCEFKS